MTPHYSWTPASEPPDTNRSVVVWVKDGWVKNGYWVRARYESGNFYTEFLCLGRFAKHWRDVEPPEDGK